MQSRTSIIFSEDPGIVVAWLVVATYTLTLHQVIVDPMNFGDGISGNFTLIIPDDIMETMIQGAKESEIKKGELTLDLDVWGEGFYSKMDPNNLSITLQSSSGLINLDLAEITSNGKDAIFRWDADDYSVDDIAKPVPEPSAAVLSLVALAGLAARRRRRI